LKDWVIETQPDGFTRVLPANKNREIVSQNCATVFLLSVCCVVLALFSDGPWRVGLAAGSVTGVVVAVPLWGSNIRWEWRVGHDLLEVRQQSFLTGSSAACYREALFEIHGFAAGPTVPTTMLFLCPAQGDKALTHLASGSPAEVRELAGTLADLTGWAIQEQMRA
jgi:hypothetical protein